MPRQEQSVSVHRLNKVDVDLLVFADANGHYIATDILGNVAESYESREAAIVRWLRENCDEYEESEAFYNERIDQGTV